MEVFISWSGEPSRQVAVAIADWLPAVLQRVKPFVSDKDIHAGARWQSEITARLDACQFGLIIVTNSNQNNRWLQFEAGALSRAVTDPRVIPILVNLKKSDLLLPLNMFQAETLDRDGIRSMLVSMNSRTEDPLPVTTIDSLVNKWWPELEASVGTIEEIEPAATTPSRSDRDLLEEVVTVVRAMRNRAVDTAATQPLPPIRDDDDFESIFLAQRARMEEHFEAATARALGPKGQTGYTLTFHSSGEAVLDLQSNLVDASVVERIAQAGIDLGFVVTVRQGTEQPIVTRFGSGSDVEDMAPLPRIHNERTALPSTPEED